MAITSAPEQLASPARARLRRSGEGTAQARTGELYARHARTVTGLCRGLLRDRGEAEDAVQQVFLSAHRALLNGSAPREPGAWLAAIARNECLSRIRSRMREPLPSAELEPESSLPDPLAEAIRRADLAALWQAVEQLPRRQRHALLLREFGGLSYEELALALGVSRPTVESLLFRARHALRDRLRAAYAAVTGASWLDAVGRLLAGSTGAAAPAAVKVVAAGMGAAVVTGGAIVAPTIAHHPAPARQARAQAAARAHRSAPHARPQREASAPTRPHAVVPAARSGHGARSTRHGDGGTTTVAARPAADGPEDRQAVASGSTSSGGSGAESSGGDRSSPSTGGSGSSGDSGRSGDGSGASGDGGGTSGDDGPATSATQVASTTSGDSGPSGDGSSGGSSTGEISGGGSSGGGSSGGGGTDSGGSGDGGSGSVSSGSSDGGSSDGGSTGSGSDGGS